MPNTMTRPMAKGTLIMTVRIEHPLHENAYIYKQKDSKNWFMDYKNANGKRTRKTSGTDDKRQALLTLSENITLIKKVKSGEITIVESKQIKVKKAVSMTIDFYEKSVKQKSAYTVYKRELRYFSERYGDLKVEDINIKILREYLDQYLSKSRFGMIKTALRRMFLLCEEGGYIDKRPDFPPDIETKDTNRREGLKKHQVFAIIKRFKDKSLNEKLPTSRRKAIPVERENARIISLLATTLYFTGARIGELRYLTPNRIWQETTDNQTLAFMDVYESKTKSRKILIPFSLYFYLKQEQKNLNLGDDDLFFRNRVNGKISEDFSKKIKRDYENNQDFYDGIGVKNLCLYRFRHTFIIERLLENKSIFMISQHCSTSIKMIMKHYSDYIVASNYTNIYNEQSKSFLDDDGKIFSPEALLDKVEKAMELAEEIEKLQSQMSSVEDD